MKKMILASLFLSCAAFGATSNLSDAKVTPSASTVATYGMPLPLQGSHKPVSSDIPLPGPDGSWPQSY